VEYVIPVCGNQVKRMKIMINWCAVFVMTLSLIGCGGAQTRGGGGSKVTPVSAIAIQPGTGVAGDALAIELFNRGFNVVDPNQTASILGNVGLTEFEITTKQAFAALSDRGIDAVLTVRVVNGYDNKPQSMSARVTSTITGSILAGATWENGWGGAQGSPADAFMRSDLGDAAEEVVDAISKQLSPR